MSHGQTNLRRLLLPLESLADPLASRLMSGPGLPSVNFRDPAGEPALVGPDSISWQIFKNPVTVFIGGVAAVILELAEPAVRAGVWEHSTFRAKPVHRLQRTGLAAYMTVYGPQSATRRMIAGVRRAHDAVNGTTEHGLPYRANDPDLLDWVQGTATFGFALAYSRYARVLSAGELSQAFAESAPAAELYGATGAPRSWEGWERQLNAMKDRLEASPVIFEFLDIMKRAPALPLPLRPLQNTIVRGAVDLVPEWVRERLGLGSDHDLRLGERHVLRQSARLADSLMLKSSPAVQACQRLGLPADYLYRRIERPAAA